uniref:M20/M25/M40 family metallo-hydrolase n=1 Tax=Bacillus songklensis TaxID=1069116 RepID=UPI00366CBF08
MTEISNAIAVSNNLSFRNLVSGAGHDAQVFGTFCPTSLLFVPSRQGISHSPKEFTSIHDLKNGIHVLAELLYRIAY